MVADNADVCEEQMLDVKINGDWEIEKVVGERVISRYIPPQKLSRLTTYSRSWENNRQNLEYLQLSSYFSYILTDFSHFYPFYPVVAFHPRDLQGKF